MATEILAPVEPRVFIVIGGGGDTLDNFAGKLQPPLVRAFGPQTIFRFIHGQWSDKKESAERKRERVFDGLSQTVDEHGRIDGLLAISMGVALSVNAATSHKNKILDKIGTFGLISGIVRPPERWSRWQKAAIRIYPALYPTVEEAADRGLDDLQPRIKTGDVLTARGQFDIKVSPELSTVAGANNIVVYTPIIDLVRSHSLNIRRAVHLPELHGHFRRRTTAAA